MAEYQFFSPEEIPEWTTPEWYSDRDAAPHLEQVWHGDRIRKTAEIIEWVIADGVSSVCDLGAGDGGLLSILSLPNHLKWGYDLQPSNVAAAEARGVDVSLGDVVKDPRLVLECGADLLIATEFLEHLVDPHAFVNTCFASGAGWIVASSPYDETPEKHYEFHTWAWDFEGYTELLENAGWVVVLVEAVPRVSQIILARRSS